MMVEMVWSVSSGNGWKSSGERHTKVDVGAEDPEVL